MQHLTKTTIHLGPKLGPSGTYHRDNERVMEVLMEWSAQNPAARIYTHLVSRLGFSNFRERPGRPAECPSYNWSQVWDTDGDLDIYWQ